MGKGKKAGNSKALWHPLAAVELTDLKRKNSESLGTFKEAERCLPANSTLTDPKRTAVAFFLSEVLEKSIHEGAPLEEVFDVVFDAIKLLENSESVANLHFFALARVVGALGLMPEIQDDTKFASLNLDSGEWCDSSPLLSASQYFLKAELALMMLDIPGMKFDNMRGLCLTPSDRKELLLGMVMFIQLHHAGLREIKSYDVLEAIFS
jgi:DNA repair protein RecO (recombination protein O)